LFSPEGLGFLRKTVAFLCHSIVMPEIGDAYGFRLSVQAKTPGAGSVLSACAIALWAALLAVAAWGMARTRPGRLAGMLLGVLTAQWLVAMLFGIETFFYSAHWAPFLVMLCALGARTSLRPAVTILAVGLMLAAAANNLPKFHEAAGRLAERYVTQRDFTAAVDALTPAHARVACGLHAAAAQGEPPRPAGGDARSAETAEIGLAQEPDTCFFHFAPELTPLRRGFLVSYEEWSLETIEALRERGASYFVTSYAWGVAHNPALFAALDQRYRRLETRPGWAFYDLGREASAERP
jgi:hypothetical protein